MRLAPKTSGFMVTSAEERGRRLRHFAQFKRFGIVARMKNIRILIVSVLVTASVGTLVVGAAKPEDFNQAQVAEIWTELWKTTDANFRAPKIDTLSEREAIQRMAGRWTVMFGVIPDRLTISLGTNRVVEVSGRKGGKDWRKTGEWRVVSNKLVLFLEEEDIPSFIFRTRQHDYIFDPWAKTMMSELRRENALGFPMAVSAAVLTWPDREAGALAWPKPRTAVKILNDRFARASTNALGSATDMTAVEAAIAAVRPRIRVEEIRWLSSDLVMVRARLPESSWYYVVERKKEGWSILIYYLKWMS